MQEHFVGRIEEIPEDACRMVWLNERGIGLIRRNGRVYAYENRCLHQGGPVCQGEVLGRYEAVLAPDRSIAYERFSERELHLVCPWHGWEYDVETGECITDRRLRLTSYPTVIRDGQVYVQIP